MNDPASESSASAGKPDLKGRIITESRLALVRVARSDFGRMEPTAYERTVLAARKPPMDDALAQGYAGWRRSLLYLASAFFVLASLLHVVAYESVEDGAVSEAQADSPELTEAQARQQVRKVYGAGNLDTLNTAPLLNLLALLATTILSVMASIHWADVARSQRLARAGSYVFLGVPLALAVVPWTHLLDLSHLQAAQAKALHTILGLIMGMQIVVMLGPRLLAILPGILRSALTLKTLLPQSAWPGLVAALAAPFYLALLVLVVAPLNQWQGGLLLFLGLLALMIAPIIYVLRARILSEPMDVERASRVVARTRRRALLGNAIGILLLMIFIFDLDLIDWSTAISMLTVGGGSLFLMSVVASDLLLSVMDGSHRKAVALQASELGAEMNRRLDVLAGSGITRRSPPASPSHPTGQPPDTECGEILRDS